MGDARQRGEASPNAEWTRWPSVLASRARNGWNRARGAMIPNTQTAILATLSWLLCHWLLGSPDPIFAPIVTLSCMGFSRNRQPRKVLEIGLGTSTGVLIGGLVGSYWGFGVWQLFLLLAVTPLIGRFIHRSELVAFQTAINSMVVASMLAMALPGAASGPLDRWLNALIGAGVSVAATVVLPTNVVTRPQRFVAFAIEELARTLRRLSKGLLDGSTTEIGQLVGQLKQMRETLNDARQALDSAQETAAISPAVFASRPVLAELDRMLGLAERLHVTLSMMVRQARHMVSEVGSMPELAAPTWQAADLLARVATGVRNWQRPTAARDEAVQLAGSLRPAEIGSASDDWRSATLVSLLRAVVVDMLELTGLSMAQARAALADVGQYQPDDEANVTGVESASIVWGTEHLPAVLPPPHLDQDAGPRQQ